MTDQNTNLLFGETLLTLKDAANDFGGLTIPLRTVQKYVYEGLRGLKLESVSINGRYTSKEAIQRFIERKQNLGQPQAKPKVKRLTQAQVDAGLRRHGIVKWLEITSTVQEGCCSLTNDSPPALRRMWKMFAYCSTALGCHWVLLRRKCFDGNTSCSHRNRTFGRRHWFYSFPTATITGTWNQQVLWNCYGCNYRTYNGKSQYQPSLCPAVYWN